MTAAPSLPTPISPRPSRTPRLRASFARLLVAVLLVSASVFLIPAPASAASPNLGWFGSGGSSGLGRWQVGSTIVYCVDPLYGSESGSNGSSYYLGVGDWLNHYGAPHKLSATEIARINWAIASYGTIPGSGTSAKRWAAAVQMYIWSITAPEVYANPGAYAGTGSGHGDTWFSARILLHGGTTADRAAVLDRLATLRAEDNAISATVPPVGGEVSIDDAADSDESSFRVTTSGVPAGVAYTLSLTNAQLPGGGTSATLTGAAALEVIADPPVGADDTGYTITARLSYTRSHWPDRIKLWKPSGGQRVAAGQSLTRSFSTTGSYAIGADVALFAPGVTTEAPRFVIPGDAFDDVVSFTATGVPGTGPWISDPDAGYLPVTAVGTLYGPFLEHPVEADEAPDDAPVVAVVRIATDPDRGPDRYRVRDDGEVEAGSLLAVEAGYYSWVWEIDAAGQSEQTQERLPADYVHRDRFGLTTETSVVPMTISASTQVTEAEVSLSAPIQDVLTVADTGPWLRRDGAPIPLTFRGTAYYVAGATPPEESGVIPDSAVELGRTTLTVSGPGSATSAPDAMFAPDEGRGYVVWRWELLPEDQPEALRGLAADWADLFGVAAETQRIVQPTLRSEAEPEVAVGAPFTDTAIIGGTLPADGAVLGFALYDAAAGEDAEPVWRSDARLVTAPGSYQSPPAPGQLPGRYYWVESLESVADRDGDGERLIAQGRWGLPEETTVVVGPEVTTSALPGAPRSVGGSGPELGPEGGAAPLDARPGMDAAGGIHDTATISGAIPAVGAELRFEAYRVPTQDEPTVPGGPLLIAYPPDTEEGDLSWVCTPENLVFRSAPQTITAAGAYRSESYPAPAHGLYLWSESLTVDLGAGPVEIHRGECGLAEETSVVLDVATIAFTDDPSGTDPRPQLWDTASLTGWAPAGGTLTFSAYRGRADAAPVCTDDTLVFTSAPHALPSGLFREDAPLRITGEPWQAPINRLAHTRVYWVQTVVDSLGRVVSRGVCGDPAETVEVPAPPLTATGVTMPLITVGLIATGMVAVGAGLLLLRRRSLG